MSGCSIIGKYFAVPGWGDPEFAKITAQIRGGYLCEIMTRRGESCGQAIFTLSQMGGAQGIRLYDSLKEAARWY